MVYDGVELLEYAIKSIRNHVDYICVLYQEVSWFGHKASKEDIIILHTLKEQGLIDDLILFDNFKPLACNKKNIIKAKRIETTKRQAGLEYCRKAGCTHYLCSDVDEFYTPSQFELAKDIIIQEGFSLTAVKYWNYVNKPIYKIDRLFGYVPFVCRLGPRTCVSMNYPFFVSCDPTRRISVGSQNVAKELFDPEIIVMHHMETVRKNLWKKYNATSRSDFKRTRTQKLISRIRNVNSKSKAFTYYKVIHTMLNDLPVISCDNIFDIPYEEWSINE